MKRTILKILASLFVFVGTLILSGYFMNKGNVNTTRTMDRATLPTISMSSKAITVNELFGYAGEVNEALFRDSITPLDDNRGVSFRISKYGNAITDITLKLRTVDGSRLIQTIDVSEYEEDDYAITVNTSFKGLIEQYKEYSLQILLTLANRETITYHTRIIDAPLYCANEKLAFVKDFHEKAGSVATNDELREYMESNYTGDNTTLAHVNIHSSMEQLGFANLGVYELSEPVITIKELALQTAVLTVHYIAGNTDAGDDYRYYVEETYRLKYTGEVMYLLDFDRTMQCINDEEALGITESIIRLGITDPDIEIKESEDGNVFAFVSRNNLYSFNISENKLACLFCFYDNDNFDERTYHNEHEIKIMNVDEAGNVSFLVYGYMNRGTYEGRVGLTYYEFDGVTNVIEEKFFIASDKTPEMVICDLNELSYLNKNGVFYFMLDRSIYSIELETLQVTEIVADLDEDMYSISESRSMLIWQTGSDRNACDVLNVLNLNTRQVNTIKAPDNEYIKPLAFMGEDFIYGLAQKDDILTDRAGRTTFPMYCMKILNEYGELLKLYEDAGIYITDVEAKGNLLSITRATKKDSEELQYLPYESDYMTNNQEREEMLNEVEVVVNGNFQKVVQIRFSKETTKKSTVKFFPQQVIYEGSKTLDYETSATNKEHYYVYFKGKLQRVSTDEAAAVKLANDNYGTVTNDYGVYVWYRANREQRNQIMDLSIEVTEEEKNEVAWCMDRLLEYEGVVRNSEYLLGKGETVLSVLDEGLADYDVLNLTGCSLDSVLYYINRDIPVLTLMNDGKAYLLIGFNQLAIVVLDPNGGWYKIGLNEAEEMFEKEGNQFITYVPNY